ncbi:8141_t:CDS:2, partial [Ambispora leptoticha]
GGKSSFWLGFKGGVGGGVVPYPIPNKLGRSTLPYATKPNGGSDGIEPMSLKLWFPDLKRFKGTSKLSSEEQLSALLRIMARKTISIKADKP